MFYSYITVLQAGDHPAIAFAASELSKYLQKMSYPILVSSSLSASSRGPVLKVGIDEKDPAPFEGLEDPELDDAILIDVENMGGRITGSNPRSVLLAVYRFLEEMGVSFIRPGEDGEIIAPNGKESCRLKETASYRHRGVCIEGADSFENILEMIDWLPKNRLNSYFTQFLTPYEFFQRWYEHTDNPLMAENGPVPTPEEVNRFIDERLTPEMKKRGLIWQATGHGWTSAVLGLPGLGWDPVDIKPAPDKVPLIAQVDGKREVFGGITLDTNLCYSSEAVQQAFCDEVLKYLEAHPAADILHIWLADNENNSCECPSCSKHRPADNYLRLLNRLDEVLTQKGLPTRLVLLAYMDLLWPPVEEQLHNPDRFIFMFAPFTRSYDFPFPTSGEGELPPFSLNHLTMPKTVEGNLVFLKAWQKVLDCDSFIYEYHLHCSRDITDYKNARIVWEDIRNLKELGLNGYISCQDSRFFLPTALGMRILGQTLWNRDLTFEEIAAGHFETLYGDDALMIQDFFSRASALFDPPLGKRNIPLPDAALAAAYGDFTAEAMEMHAFAVKKLLSATGTQALTWLYLAFWCGFAVRVAQLCQKRAGGAGDETLAAEEKALKAYIQTQEPAVQRGFDTWSMIRALKRKMF